MGQQRNSIKPRLCTTCGATIHTTAQSIMEHAKACKAANQAAKDSYALPDTHNEEAQ